MRISTSATRKFNQLLVGAPCNVLPSLANFSHLSSGIGLYDPRTKSLEPLPKSIPWPVIWLLLTHSFKHRFCSSAVPDFTWLRNGLASFFNRAKWRLYFERNPSSGSRLPKSFTGSVPHCGHIVDPDFELWSKRFRARVMRHAVSYSRHMQYSNSFGLQRLALRLLRNLPYFVVKDDKASGFSFIHSSYVQEFHRLALKPPLYQPVHPQYIGLNGLQRQCSSLAFRIQKLEDRPGLASRIFPDPALPVATSLGTTLKTHKDPGEIVPRTIHQSLTPVLTGFSQWIVSNLKPHVDNLSHLMPDSFSFKSRIEDCEMLPDTAVMACIDLKDCFLSGTPSQLARDCSVPFVADRNLKSTFVEVLSRILQHQYVIASSLPDWYRCEAGSGIGLLHSSVVANWAYFRSVEVQFIYNLQKYGILLYLRYHDDIFIVSRCRESLREFQNFYIPCHAYSYFMYLCRSVSSTKVQMLDLTITISGCKISAFPTLEKSPVPLNVTSAHFPAVHKSCQQLWQNVRGFYPMDAHLP